MAGQTKMWLVVCGSWWQVTLGRGLGQFHIGRLEFGAVGGSKLSKNGSVWAGKKGFRCMGWRGGGI